MTLVAILNLVLALAVIGTLLGLLSWAIISSRARPPLTSELRQRAPHQRSLRPQSPYPQTARQRVSVGRQRSGSQEPATG